MSARRSRLETLLRVRRVEEELSRARLGAAVAAQQHAGRSLQAAREHYADAEVWAGDGGVQPFLAHRAHLRGRASGVVTAGTALTQAAEHSAGARDEWSQAAMRLTGLERLAERAREAQRLERLATDQRTAEETASANRRRAR